MPVPPPRSGRAAAGAADPEALVRQVLRDPAWRDAWHFLRRHLDRYVEEIVAVTQVPAPTFAEEPRARYVASRLEALGLAVQRDGAGNVWAPWPAPAPAPGPAAAGPVVISAHLDTVFPASTPLAVRRQGRRLYAPGIGDNSASVACLLLLAGALRDAAWTPRVPVVWLFNTGEEGLGNLRGMRAFLDACPVPPAAMLVLDGGLGMLCYRGVGSRRLRVTFTGPGGHSWKDFGQPSAIVAAGCALARLAALEVPATPRTTWNAGRIEGGTSVNTIAPSCRLELDLRSEDAGALAELERAARGALEAAAREEGVAVHVEVVGDRPQGALPAGHPLVELLRAAMRACGVPAHDLPASTDANLPLSRGIPAVTFGIRHGDGAHTLDEYIEQAGLDRGLRLALLALLATVRWAEAGAGAGPVAGPAAEAAPAAVAGAPPPTSAGRVPPRPARDGEAAPPGED
ncbi:peptidase M20 [Thermaerobacter marianensis DSM 12885]|uniref:Peptidase M20 n=1 Tax=Thermaerobacter marianensis (strain ATCC 700841 / DSM 12885 / JCM 10246 / 7p75a) TaxID=644966 RepID=E6SMD1_THEM7|nr:M20/M25/M40 family metallo-hydrolase [Thermaerobacter marianensis]ADU51490.1 peptidase M20 [Thermaerobacter marianensis DSM 12885]